MRCFYVVKKWSSANLSLNRDLSLNKMSLNRDCTVLSIQMLSSDVNFNRTLQKGWDSQFMPMSSKLYCKGISNQTLMQCRSWKKKSQIQGERTLRNGIFLNTCAYGIVLTLCNGAIWERQKNGFSKAIGTHPRGTYSN